MAPPVNIPEWSPLNLSGMEQIPLIYQAARKARVQEEALRQNAETQRQFAVNQDRKLSAELARAEWEHKHKIEREQRQDAIDRGNAVGKMFGLVRRGRPEEAAAMGAPYGASISPVAEPEPTFDAEPRHDPNVAQFLMSGGVSREAEAEALNGAWHPPMARPAGMPSKDPGIYEEPLQGPTASGAPLNETTPRDEDWASPASLAARPDPEPTLPLPTAVAMKRFEPQTKAWRIRTPEGKSYDAPISGHAGETGLGREYDELYAYALDRFGDEGKAFQAVLAKAEKDNTIRAMGGRQEDRQADAERYKLTVEQQLREKQLQRDQSEKNARIGASARERAAGVGGGGGAYNPKIEANNAAALARVEARANTIRQSSGWAKLLEAEKTMEALERDVATGAVPLQHREAQVLAAKIIRGRVTDQEMRHLFDNIGGAADAFNRFASVTLQGRLSREQLRQLQLSTKVLIDAHKKSVLRAAQAAKSGWLDPAFDNMPSQAQHAFDVQMDELGLPHEQLRQTTGGVTLGSGKPATVQQPTAAPAAEDSDEAFLKKYGIK